MTNEFLESPGFELDRAEALPDVVVEPRGNGVMEMLGWCTGFLVEVCCCCCCWKYTKVVYFSPFIWEVDLKNMKRP